MGWELDSITAPPTRTLERWRVMEIPFDGPGKAWTCHFVGFKLEGCVGQVSTPVHKFDPITRRGLTRSGRIYELRGDSGFNGDASAIWAGFKHANQIEDERDISQDFERLLATNNA